MVRAKDQDIPRTYPYEVLFQKILYVSKQGNDSNLGISWETAFLTIPKAVEEGDDSTLILIDEGDYDVDSVGALTLAELLGMRSRRNRLVTLYNSNATATAILEFTDGCCIGELSFNLSHTLDVSGLIISSNSVLLDNIRIDGTGTTNAVNGIEVTTGITGLETKGKVLIAGNGDNTIGLLQEGGGLHEINGFRFFLCKKGISLNSVNENNSAYEDLIFNFCYTPIHGIAGQSGNAFRNVLFVNTTGPDQIDDAGDNIYVQGSLKSDKRIIQAWPAGVDGGVLVSGAASEIQGAIVDIIAAAAFAFHFEVIGIILYAPTAVDKNHLVNLYQGDASSEVLFHEENVVSGKKSGGGASIENVIFNNGSRISASIGIQDGGSKTAKLQIQYVRW